MNLSKNQTNIALGVLLLILPIVLQQFGNAWVRIADMALLYILLAVGLNIVVGYAGLLDLGYVAFYAVGAYLYALLASPHLLETFPALAAMFPTGLHTPLWLVIPLGALLAGLMGALLGAPTLKLRGDYLAIVTLGFGEIIRVFMNNLDQPINITNGPKGLGSIDAVSVLGHPLSKRLDLGFIELIRVKERFGFQAQRFAFIDVADDLLSEYQNNTAAGSSHAVIGNPGGDAAHNEQANDDQWQTPADIRIAGNEGFIDHRFHQIGECTRRQRLQQHSQSGNQQKRPELHGIIQQTPVNPPGTLLDYGFSAFIHGFSPELWQSRAC